MPAPARRFYGRQPRRGAPSAVVVSSRPSSVRPTLLRHTRSKAWTEKVMSEYMNRDMHLTETPYKKFRRACKAIRIIASICLLIKRYADKKKHKQREHSFMETKMTIQEEIRQQIAFDINQFKCQKGLRHLGGERLKRMLSAPEEKRNVKIIMALLRENEEFQKYPQKTQADICKCAIYQRYGPRRIILREGHTPEGFYIVLSGHLLVNVFEENPRTGVKFVTTVSEVGAGGTFGERSLLSRSPRTSTVVCRTGVELLVIMSEDFERVVREPLLQRQENHIEYVKSLPLFRHFPVDKIKSIPNAFTCKCFRKDRIVLPCSEEPDQLVIIKEGHCRVIAEVKVPHRKKVSKSTEEQKMEELFPMVIDRRRRQEQKRRCQSATSLEWETGEMRDLMRANILMGITEPERILHVQANEDEPTKKVESWIMNKKGLSKIYARLEERKKQIINGTTTPPCLEDSDSPTSSGSSIGPDRPAMDRFAQTAKQKLQEKTVVRAGVSRTFKRISMLALQVEAAKQKADEVEKNASTHYARVATLGQGSIFGLETIFQKFPTRLTLISDGAECIFISKKVFIRECNPQVLHTATNIVVSYPSDLYVKRQMKEKRDWSRYRRNVITDLRRSKTEFFDLRGTVRAKSARV